MCKGSLEWWCLLLRCSVAFGWALGLFDLGRSRGSADPQRGLEFSFAVNPGEAQSRSTASTPSSSVAGAVAAAGQTIGMPNSLLEEAFCPSVLRWFGSLFLFTSLGPSMDGGASSDLRTVASASTSSLLLALELFGATMAPGSSLEEDSPLRA
ncbi:hypothetical protein EJB05_31603 [Eragrostis curvula]|uniref:Uncharacterized protein n=1 Tax=Eragrostis curvula TaxID=38414 RepID=A0A5J9UE22_9POAL|nr:hypothetical protein EJB05_31603 [Eragrostis curvula]